MTEMEYKQKQALDILKAQYDMHMQTIETTEKRMRDTLRDDGSKMYTEEQIEDKIRQIRSIVDDTVLQYVQTGGNEEDLYKKTKTKKRTTKAVEDKVIKPIVREKENNKTENKKRTTMSYIPKKREYGNSVQFDVIPLPSKGEVYKNKLSGVQVAYLTANDENMFVSPNLYRNGLLVDFLLTEKILEDGVEPSELLDGDRDAIILWLRATGYGNEFPITAKDSETGVEFDSVIDLSDIKFKEFNLKSDENGYFDYELPLSKDLIKFKFLNHREVEELKKMDMVDSPAAVKARLSSIAQDLRSFLDADESMNKAEKSKLYESCRNIEDWEEGIDEEGE